MARRRINLRANSRARYSTLFFKGDFEWFGQPEYPSFPPADDDEFITVTKTTQIDGLAQKYYKDPTLWFVIAIANNIELWPSDVAITQTLRIPSRKNVDSILGTPRRL
jgi:hypothetical protein